MAYAEYDNIKNIIRGMFQYDKTPPGMLFTEITKEVEIEFSAIGHDIPSKQLIGRILKDLYDNNRGGYQLMKKALKAKEGETTGFNRYRLKVIPLLSPFTKCAWDAVQCCNKTTMQYFMRGDRVCHKEYGNGVVHTTSNLAMVYVYFPLRGALKCVYQGRLERDTCISPISPISPISSHPLP